MNLLSIPFTLGAAILNLVTQIAKSLFGLCCLPFKWILPKGNKEKLTQQSGRKILAIGVAGVGKTKLFHQIKKNYGKRNQKDLPFQEIDLAPNYQFVDTPTMDFCSSIDIREENIKIFSQYFLKNGHLIKIIFIVVNFERTDLMKNKITEIYKYFQKFQKKLGIIVTDFQNSENPEKDKEDLRKAFTHYKIPNERILFTSNSMSSEEVKKQLLSSFDQFNLNETIFEPENKEEQEEIIRELTETLTNRK